MMSTIRGGSGYSSSAVTSQNVLANSTSYRTFNIGDTCILIVTCNNSGAFGAPPAITISDSSGNIWTRINNYLVNTGGTSNSGVYFDIYKTVITSSTVGCAFSISFNPATANVITALYKLVPTSSEYKVVVGSNDITKNNFYNDINKERVKSYSTNPILQAYKTSAYGSSATKLYTNVDTLYGITCENIKYRKAGTNYSNWDLDTTVWQHNLSLDQTQAVAVMFNSTGLARVGDTVLFRKKKRVSKAYIGYKDLAVVDATDCFIRLHIFFFEIPKINLKNNIISYFKQPNIYDLEYIDMGAWYFSYKDSEEIVAIEYSLNSGPWVALSAGEIGGGNFMFPSAGAYRFRFKTVAFNEHWFPVDYTLNVPEYVW